ncbi:hypothetical protein PGIGA_G00039310, partial [Pangasianodon gigas]|nr:hypothetical protein [Pangasianodon gigas]
MFGLWFWLLKLPGLGYYKPSLHSAPFIEHTHQFTQLGQHLAFFRFALRHLILTYQNELKFIATVTPTLHLILTYQNELKF